jgi:hypothetical protein
MFGRKCWVEGALSEHSVNLPIESFVRGHEENLLRLSPQQAEAWLDLIEETGRTPEGMGMTGHFLYIGQK